MTLNPWASLSFNSHVILITYLLSNSGWSKTHCMVEAGLEFHPAFTFQVLGLHIQLVLFSFSCKTPYWKLELDSCAT